MHPTATDRPAVLITGASRGLGALMARHLADEGYTVFAGMRRPTPAHDPDVRVLPLDVTDTQSIAAAAAAIVTEVGDAGLFAHVNKAPKQQAGPLECVTPDQVDRHLRTNVTGVIATTQALLPLLRSGGGRIVNVSSVNAQLPMPYWGLYSASKAAVVALSEALRIELAPWGIDVTVLTLGAFATNIRDRAVRAWPPTPTGDVYEEARRTNEALADMLDATASDPSMVALAVAEILRAEHPPAHCAVGDGIEDLLALAAQPTETRQAVIGDLLAGAAASRSR